MKQIHSLHQTVWRRKNMFTSYQTSQQNTKLSYADIIKAKTTTQSTTNVNQITQITHTKKILTVFS